MKKEKPVKIKLITVLTILCGLIAFVSVFSRSLLSLYLTYKFNIDTRNASSIGIIGGADGPTSVFLSGEISFNWFTAIFVLLTIMGAIYLIISKYKRSQD